MTTTDFWHILRLFPVDKILGGCTISVLIIGGGVIGVCTAYYLKQHGFDVTLVEKGQIGAGSSHGNAGLICPAHSTPLAAPGVISQGLKWMLDSESPFYIKPRLDPALLRWLWHFRAHCKPEPFQRAVPLFRDLHRASLQLYSKLITDEDLNCHFQQRGGLTVFKNKYDLESGQREMEEMEAFGLKMALLDADTILSMETALRPDIAGGIHMLEDGHMDPALFVAALGQHLADQGVDLRTESEVIGFETINSTIRTVHTTRGDLHPDQVVLAAGAWSTAVVRDLKLGLPMQPAKGYSITIQRPENSLQTPVHFGESRVVATPMGPHLRFAGTMELAGFDFTINQRRVNAILRAAQSYMIGVDEMEVVEIWRGMRPLPPDGLPYIGRPASLDNLVVATGHSYLGLSMGTITGQLVSELIRDEQPSIDLTLLDVDRF